DPGAVGLFGRARVETDVVGRLRKVVETEVGFRFMDRDRGEVEIVLHEARYEVRLLLRRHAQLEPVARAAGGQHEVVGSAELAGGELFGHQARSEMIRHARAAVLLLEDESTKAELRTLLQ